MKPVTFKGHNRVLAKNQPPYIPLPIFTVDSDGDGRTVSCWKLNFFERLMVLVTGRIWCQLLTFRRPQQPVKLSVGKPMLESHSVALHAARPNTDLAACAPFPNE